MTKQEAKDNISLQSEHSVNDLKFINSVIDEYENSLYKEIIFWIKDWWAEDMPYGLKGIIKRLNKLKKYER